MNEESLARAERIQARKNFFLTSAERKHAITGQVALANHSQAVFEESVLHDVTSYRETTWNRSHVGGQGVLRGVDQSSYNRAPC